MAKSEITKKAIASSFKRLLETTSFEQITVSAIAAECGINRQTFYYHFRDIYDLVGWIVDNEIIMSIGLSSTCMHEAVVEFLETLKTNRNVIMYRLRSADPFIMHDLFKDRMVKFGMHALGTTEHAQQQPSQLDLMTIAFCMGGFAEVVLNWIEDGCSTSPSELALQIERILPNILTQLASKPATEIDH